MQIVVLDTKMRLVCQDTEKDLEITTLPFDRSMGHCTPLAQITLRQFQPQDDRLCLCRRATDMRIGEGHVFMETTAYIQWESGDNRGAYQMVQMLQDPALPNRVSDMVSRSLKEHGGETIPEDRLRETLSGTSERRPFDRDGMGDIGVVWGGDATHPHFSVFPGIVENVSKRHIVVLH